jgi:hypothetical protein
MYDDMLGRLYSEEPVEYFKMIDETYYKVVQNGKEKVFQTDRLSRFPKDKK